MPFSLGNQFWRNRSKHGRDKLFASPELLLEAAYEYFDWCDQNPLTSEDFKGKDAQKVIYNLGRPYTLSGLCIYLDASERWWGMFRSNKDLSDDFLRVTTRIEDIIRTQKFEGAAVGIFNHNIIARDLGLSDKKEIIEPAEPTIDLSQLTDEELDQLASLDSLLSKATKSSQNTESE